MTFPKSYHLFASASYFVIILSISLLLLLPKITMADAAAQSCPSASESAVHIVYTEQPPENEEPEAYHIRTLSSVLGSEEAAKEALLYSYKTVASGFSAKLTPEQVLEMTNQPGVVQVVPSQKLQLHAGKGTRC